MVDDIKVSPKSEFECAASTEASVEQEAGTLSVVTVQYIILGGDSGFMARKNELEIDAPVSNAPPVPEWQVVVKAVANGQMDPAQVFNLAPNTASSTSGLEELR